MRRAAWKLWFTGLLVLLVASAAAMGVRQLASHAAPALALAPKDLDFGRVAIGASGESVLVVTNTGARRSRVEAVPAAGPFQLASTALDLDPGESRAISVAFRPSERGPVAATIALASEGHEHTVAVRGTGYRPAEIQVSPLSLSFGEVAIGAAAEGLVTIRNLGDEPLELAAVRGERPFEARAPASIVAPGEAMDVSVAYAPRRAGRHEGLLWIESSDPTRARVGLQLRGSGTAIAPRPALESSAGALDFGQVPACELREQWVELANRGADPLAIASITTYPPFSASARSFRLEPGRSFRLRVAFSPTEAGPVLSALLIHSNDPRAGVVALSLLGEGGSARDCTGTAQRAPTPVDALGREVELALETGGGGAWKAPSRADPMTEPSGAEPSAKGEPSASADATAAAPPPVREGSFVHFGSYRSEITSENVASVRVDPGSGNLSLDGVQLPVVQLPFDQFFDFEPSGAAGRLNELGEVELVLPVDMVDEEGNPTRLELALTTGTAASLGRDGTLVTLAGEALGAQGDATLVGLATLPSGGLEGATMGVVLNVHVEP